MLSNIGFIIPTAVLKQFLGCVGADGVASLGIGRVQALESLALRRKLGLPEGFTGGVRVPAVWPLGPAVGKLEVDDVIVAVDGVEIGQDATVSLRDNERIHFLHLITQRLAGRDTVNVRFMRKGRHEDADIHVRPDRWLAPRIDGYDAAPEYCIIGGLVFIPLSQPWAELKVNDKAARALLLHHWGSALPEKGRQVVVLSKVLAHPCNFGFHAISNMVLDTFNSVSITSVAQLAEAVYKCEEDSFIFEFLRPAGDGKELVVIDRKACKEAESEILAQHLIASTSMVRTEGFPVGDLRPFPACVSLESDAAGVKAQ